MEEKEEIEVQQQPESGAKPKLDFEDRRSDDDGDLRRRKELIMSPADQDLLITRTNTLLACVGIHAQPLKILPELQQSASSMFVAIFEAIWQMRLREIVRKPVLPEHWERNAQVVITKLRALPMSRDRLSKDVTGASVVAGDLRAIRELVDVFTAIVDVYLPNPNDSTRLDDAGGLTSVYREEKEKEMLTDAPDKDLSFAEKEEERRSSRVKYRSKQNGTGRTALFSLAESTGTAEGSEPGRVRRRNVSSKPIPAGGGVLTSNRPAVPRSMKRTISAAAPFSSKGPAVGQRRSIAQRQAVNKHRPQTAIPSSRQDLAAAKTTQSRAKTADEAAAAAIAGGGSSRRRLSSAHHADRCSGADQLMVGQGDDTLLSSIEKAAGEGDTGARGGVGGERLLVAGALTTEGEMVARQMMGQHHRAMWRQFLGQYLAGAEKKRGVRRRREDQRANQKHYLEQKYKAAVADHKREERMRIRTEARQAKFRNQALMHKEKVEQIKALRLAEQLQAQKLSDRMKRETLSKNRIRNLLKQLVKQMNEWRREEEKAQLNDMKELHQYGSSKAETIEHTYRERLGMLEDLARARAVENRVVYKAQEEMLASIVTEFTRMRDSRIRRALEQNEQYREAALRQSDELFHNIHEAIHREDWDSVRRDRMMTSLSSALDGLVNSDIRRPAQRSQVSQERRQDKVRRGAYVSGSASTLVMSGSGAPSLSSAASSNVVRGRESWLA